MKPFFSLIMMVICLFGLTINNTFAQTESTTVEKQLMFIGVESDITEGVVVDNVNNYSIQNFTKEITSISNDSINEIDNDKNHIKTNYFITPTLIPLDKNKVIVRTIMFSSNQINVGLTKNISVSGGFDALSMHPDRKLIWNVSAKVGFEVTDNVYLGGGVNYRANSLFDLSMAYGGVTIGNADNNFTIGMGSTFNKEKDQFFNKPAFSFSGMYRLNDKYLLVSENLFFNNNSIFEQDYSPRGNDYVGVHGIRYVDKRSSLDLGFMMTKVDLHYLYRGMMAIPYFGYKINISEWLK